MTDRPRLAIKVNVFVSGAVVMALEIIGSRLLAPVFGNTIYVWGSLIGVVLTSLSLGYFLGGKLADLKPTFHTFCSIIFSAGLLVLLVPTIASPIFDYIVGIGLGERYGPLLATFLILTAPSVLLGMVSPFAIRLTAQSFSNLGNISGNLYSLSTVGSITGTFLTVFVLIPEFGVNRIVLGLGLALLAASAYGLTFRVKILLLILLVVLPLMAPYTMRRSTVAAYHLTLGNTVFETDTVYHHLAVVDSLDPLTGRKIRTLVLDDNLHSAMDLSDPSRAVYVYTEYFHFGFIMSRQVEDVLFIGGGGFTGPKSFLANYDWVSVDVVEIDPEVIKVAKTYFDVIANPRLKIFNMDGRLYLAQSSKKYDLIILDAYSKTYVPFHMMTLEFFRELRRDLKPNGVVISNLIASVSGSSSRLLEAESKTMAAILPQVLMFPTRGASNTFPQNIMLVGLVSPEPVTIKTLTDAITQSNISKKRALAQYLSNLYEASISDAPILTDDFAPVEMLLNPVTGHPLTKDENEARSILYTEAARIGALTVILAVAILVIPKARMYISGRKHEI